MADGETIERLVVEFDAKTDKILDKLNGLNRSVHGSAQEIGRSFSNINVGRSLDRVFDESRVSLIRQGGLNLRLFGTALEPLGPLGIAAGAGIAATALAIGQAIKAADWAEQLQKTAKTIGVSTTALQEFDFVATASGIKTEVFRESIQRLNEKIGQMQAGIALGRSKKVFEALDLSPEQLRRLGSITEILPVIAEKLAALPAAERAGLAARLDITPILPALLKGKVGLSDLVAEAHKYGVVVDADVIAKSAAAAEKLHVMGEVINSQVKTAFADLSPFVADVAGKLADAARSMADFIHEARDALEPISRLIAKLREIPAVNVSAGAIGGFDKWLLSGGLEGQAFRALAHKGRNDKLRDSVLALAKGARPSAEFEAEYQDTYGGGKPVNALVHDAAKNGRHGPKGRNPDEVAKASADAIARATEEELRARNALTRNAGQRLAIETQLLATETAHQIADLESNVTLKKITRAAADQAESAIKAAAAEKQALLNRDAAFKIEDKEIEVHNEKVGALLAQLADDAAMAATGGERRKIEARILAIRQQQERDLLGSRLDRDVKQGDLEPEKRDEIEAAVASRQKADTQKTLYDTYYGAIHGALDAAVRGGWPGLAKYMADKLKQNIVDALANSLTNLVIGGGGSGGGGWISAIFAAASHAIPGYATGTGSAPGGLSIVGERGPELLNVPKGAQVLPNSALANIGVTRGMSVTTQAFSFDLRGAVVTADLVDQMNRIASAAEQRATVNGAALGVQAARAIVPREMSRAAALRIR